MDLFDVVRSCFRRWYVVLPLLIVAAWYSHHIYTSVKPVYYSQAVVGFVPPNTQQIQAPPDQYVVPRNGLLDAGGPALLANMAMIGLRDPAVVSQVVSSGGAADYVAKMFPVPATSPPLPMIMIEATEPYPDSASKTVELVVAQAEPALRAVQAQAGVPEGQMVKPFVVSPPSAAVAGIPSRTRATITVFVAGTGLAILIGVVFDLVVPRWRTRHLPRRQGKQNNPQVSTADPNTTAIEAEADEVAVDSR